MTSGFKTEYYLLPIFTCNHGERGVLFRICCNDSVRSNIPAILVIEAGLSDDGIGILIENSNESRLLPSKGDGCKV